MIVLNYIQISVWIIRILLTTLIVYTCFYYRHVYPHLQQRNVTKNEKLSQRNLTENKNDQKNKKTIEKNDLMNNEIIKIRSEIKSVANTEKYYYSYVNLSEPIYDRTLLLNLRLQSSEDPLIPLMKLVHVSIPQLPKARGGKKRIGIPTDRKKIRSEFLVDEKTRLEYLMNFVAFHRNETFDDIYKRITDGSCISTDDAETANEQAQMLLKAAIDFNHGNIASRVWNQLNEASFEITPLTFELLIEACIHSKDLKGASDFMNKMENHGMYPDTKLLGKVMILYQSQKVKCDDESLTISSPLTTPYSINTTVPEVKQQLSPHAPIFFDTHELRKKNLISLHNLDETIATSHTATSSPKIHDTDLMDVKPSTPTKELSASAPVFVPVYSENAKEISVNVTTGTVISRPEEKIEKESTLNAQAVPFQPLNVSIMEIPKSQNHYSVSPPKPIKSKYNHENIAWDTPSENNYMPQDNWMQNQYQGNYHFIKKGSMQYNWGSPKRTGPQQQVRQRYNRDTYNDYGYNYHENEREKSSEQWDSIWNEWKEDNEDNDDLATPKFKHPLHNMTAIPATAKKKNWIKDSNERGRGRRH